MLDITKLVGRGGIFKVAQSGAVQDMTLLGIATEYENNVMRKVVGVSPSDWKTRVVSEDPVLETTKYDGEGVFVYFEKDKSLFVFSAPSGRVRIGFPALTDMGKKLEKAGIRKALVRCELWLPPGVDQRRRGIADVTRVTFNGTDTETAEFKLVALDLIMIDGRDLRANQSKFQETWDLLKTVFGDDRSQPSFRMLGSIVPESSLAEVFSLKSGAGDEGIVVRRLDRPDIVKIKPYRSVDAVVIGYVEGELESSYGVTSILVGLNYPGTLVAPDEVWLQTFVRVGTGFTDPERVSLLSALQPLKVSPPLPMTDSDGRTVHFIRPERIAEIGGEDMVTQIGGVENRTQLLLWNRAQGTYTFSGLTPVPRLTFARFVRWREDKRLEQGGARLEQIIANPVRPEVRPQQKKDPRRVRRTVYAKGTDMVRKLVIVENPVFDQSGFRFSVFWTDFSSKRAAPLKTSTYVAKTEERARLLGENLLKENITKGFVIVQDESTAAPETPKPSESSDPEPGPAPEPLPPLEVLAPSVAAGESNISQLEIVSPLAEFSVPITKRKAAPRKKKADTGTGELL